MALEVKAGIENLRRKRRKWKSLKNLFFLSSKRINEEEHAEMIMEQTCHSLYAARRYRCQYNSYSDQASRHSLINIEQSEVSFTWSSRKYVPKAVNEPGGPGTLHKPHVGMRIFLASFPRPTQYTCNISQLKVSHTDPMCMIEIRGLSLERMEMQVVACAQPWRHTTFTS